MQGITKPSSTAVSIQSIPAHIRDANPELVKFLEYYYEWMSQDGNPLDLINNIVEYRDVTQTTPEFLTLITQQLLSFIPATANVNKNLLATKIKDFYKAKGTLPSYQFMMELLFQDTVNIQWNSDKVFRPSSNASIRDGQISVYSDAQWNSSAAGSTLIQTQPTNASASIDSCIPIFVNGRIVNIIDLDPESIVGEFAVNGDVKVLKDTVNRSWTYVDVYYDLVSYTSATKTIVVSIFEETPRTYIGLVSRQVGSDFRGVISQFVSRQVVNNRQQLTAVLSNVTGTLGTGQMYAIAAITEPTHYTTADYLIGTVAPSVTDITLSSGGALYETGEHIQYIGGSGTTFHALVNDIGGGGVENIDIVAAGHGYSVGDALSFDNSTAGGSDGAAIVTHVDGYGAEIRPTMELDNFHIRASGQAYAVGDVVRLTQGAQDITDYPTTFTVSSISTAFNMQSLNITNKGYGYQYAQLKLLNVTANTLIPSFTGTATIKNTWIDSITINAYPTLTTDNLRLLINGYGATVTLTNTAGVISLNTLTNGGFNYVNPVILITSSTQPSKIAQFAFTLDASGTITNITVIDGGAGYGTITVSIQERYGYNAAATPIISNPTTGPITGLTVTNRGTYDATYAGTSLYTLPNCFNAQYVDNSVNGSGLIVDLKYRVKGCELVSPGAYFRQATIDTTHGLGRGASCIPVISDGVISSLTVTTHGSAYTYAHVTVTGTGMGFHATANIVTGAVDTITVISGGIGYTSGDQVNIYGDGINAAASINVVNGVITQMVLVSGGVDYAYDTDVVYEMNPVQYPSAVAASFTPVIVDGTIKEITVISGGSGYVSVANDLLTEDSNTLTTESGVLVAFDSPYDVPLFTSGTPALITFNAAGRGSVQAASVDAGGTGYKDPVEVAPLEVYVNTSTGDGATVAVVLESGRVFALHILHGGGGYSLSDTLSVVGGGGSDAVLHPVFSNGKLVDIIIVNGGGAYQHGTSVLVVGDGVGAEIYANVNTSITSIDVLTSGTGYAADTYITVADVTGSGMTSKMRLDALGGIVGVDIISGGTLYTNPVITLHDSTGFGHSATFKVNVPRNISSLSILDGGTGYTAAQVFVFGDGSGAAVSVKLENNGSLSNPHVVSTGGGYVSTPTFDISDISQYGAVTGVKLLNGGFNYKKPPVVSLPIKYDIHGAIIAEGAEFISFGNNIGHIKGVAFTDFGTGWEEKPHFIFPLHCVMQENVNFVYGEEITVEKYPYKAYDSLFDLLLEDGGVMWVEEKLLPIATEDMFTLLCENGDIIHDETIGDLEQEFYEVTNANGVKTPHVDLGPIGHIAGVDFSRRIVEIADVSENFNFVTEDGATIISENGLVVGDEASNGISVGDVIIGAQSKARATVKRFNRAAGDAFVSGVGLTKKAMTNNVGVLDNPGSKVHDGQRIQDYSYVIRTGTSLDKYESILTNTVHPAGYKMYGDVVVSHFGGGHPVNVPYSFGIKGASSSFSTTVNIKNIFVNYHVMLNKNLNYYAAEKNYFYTTAAEKFADYTFDNYDWTSGSFISNHTPLAEIEPYVTNLTQSNASATKGNGIITGINSTMYITSGQRVQAWDSFGNTIFTENKMRVEDATFLMSEDGSFLTTAEDVVFVESVMSASTIIVSKNSTVAQTITVAVQSIPYVEPIINTTYTSSVVINSGQQLTINAGSTITIN